MKDLTLIAAEFVTKHGAEKAAELIGKNVGVVQKWMNGNQPPVVDLQKLLAYDESFLSVPAPVVDMGDAPPFPSPPDPALQWQWPRGTRVAILMPSNRAPHLHLLKCFASLYERDKMQFIPLKTNMPPTRGRNVLADRFLASGCEWSYWWDDDTVLPHGDVGFYREVTGNPQFPADYANLNPIARLMSQNRKLIGGCYFGRSDQGRAQFSNAFINPMADAAAHNGPRNFVEETAWIGFGATLVHRSVFEDIIRTQPEIEIKDPALIQMVGYRYRFFNALSVTGNDSENSEDNCFCTRALRAGHRTYVDHAVVPTHMGERGYSYHNTRKQQAGPMLFGI